jgi:hypothetical protein
MKKIIVTLFIILSAIVTNAQLMNTKWKGVLPVNPLEVILDFKADTLLAFNAQDNSVMETMSYTVTDSAFTLQKISGQSDCNSDSKGKYRFDIKEGVLYIKVISDDCDGRSFYLSNTKWTKMQ